MTMITIHVKNHHYNSFFYRTADLSLLTVESRGTTFGWLFMLMTEALQPAVQVVQCTTIRGQMAAIVNLQEPFVPNFIKIKNALRPQ